MSAIDVTYTDVHWDGPTENVIYLGYVANISKEKNPSKKPY